MYFSCIYPSTKQKILAAGPRITKHTKAVDAFEFIIEIWSSSDIEYIPKAASAAAAKNPIV